MSVPANPEWWDALTRKQQQKYLSEHPNSDLKLKPITAAVKESLKGAFATGRSIVKRANDLREAVQMSPKYQAAKQHLLDAPAKAKSYLTRIVNGASQDPESESSTLAQKAMKGFFMGLMGITYITAIVFGGETHLSMLGTVSENLCNRFATYAGRDPIFDTGTLTLSASRSDAFSRDEQSAFAGASSAMEAVELGLLQFFLHEIVHLDLDAIK